MSTFFLRLVVIFSEFFELSM